LYFTVSEHASVNTLLPEAAAGMDPVSSDSVSIKTDWDRMKEKAQSCGLQVVDVQQNGSCMFAALAHQLGRSAEVAEIIRSEITGYMRQNEPSMVTVIYHCLSKIYRVAKDVQYSLVAVHILYNSITRLGQRRDMLFKG
jgi:hypothetical protein